MTEEQLLILLRKHLAHPGPYEDIMQALETMDDGRPSRSLRCRHLWALHEEERRQLEERMLAIKEQDERRRDIPDRPAPTSMPGPGVPRGGG